MRELGFFFVLTEWIGMIQLNFVKYKLKECGSCRNERIVRNDLG